MKQFIDFDAETKKSSEAEGSILKKFVQSNKRHENRLVTKASLEYGGIYSLFFDLAKYSLWDYFRDPEVSITAEQKGTVFGRSVGLAGALAFLHEGLYLDSTDEQLQCYHLDLKSQNILVFERRGSKDGDMWKISDFGISQMKHIRPSGADVESDHPVSFLDRIFRPQKQDTDPSSGVDNSRYGGTYGAPEARLTTEKVTRKSDVWSLGCVIIDVLTFLDSGTNGIEEFRIARAKDRDNDRFFELSSPQSGTEANYILHSSVISWLKALADKAKKSHELEGEAFRQALALLQDSFLLADQGKRCAAKEVERHLIRIKSQFARPAAKPPSPLQGLQRLPISPTKPPARLSKIPDRIKRVFSRKASPSQPWKIWRFQLAAGSTRCKLSSDGQYLAVESKGLMITTAISDIKKGVPGQVHGAPRNRQWAGSALGTRYLCTALGSRYFEVHPQLSFWLQSCLSLVVLLRITGKPRKFEGAFDTNENRLPSKQSGHVAK